MAMVFLCMRTPPPWYSQMEKIGILFGDYPHNFKAMFTSLGYEVEIENLGWGGMYQFIKLRL